MAKKYTVQWPYRSNIGGPWGTGGVVTVDDDVAEAIDRDSPGVLVLFVPEPEPEILARALETPPQDRLMASGRKRVKPPPAPGVPVIEGEPEVQEIVIEEVIEPVSEEKPVTSPPPKRKPAAKKKPAPKKVT